MSLRRKWRHSAEGVATITLVIVSFPQVQAAIHQDGLARYQAGTLDQPNRDFRYIVGAGGFRQRYALFVVCLEFRIVSLGEAIEVPACFDESWTNRIDRDMCPNSLASPRVRPSIPAFEAAYANLLTALVTPPE